MSKRYFLFFIFVFVIVTSSALGQDKEQKRKEAISGLTGNSSKVWTLTGEQSIVINGECYSAKWTFSSNNTLVISNCIDGKKQPDIRKQWSIEVKSELDTFLMTDDETFKLRFTTETGSKIEKMKLEKTSSNQEKATKILRFERPK